MESLVGPAWGITRDGLDRLGDVDEEGDSLFRNAHNFYRDSLKEGPQLDGLTLNFVKYVRMGLDDWFSKASGDVKEVNLRSWSRALLGAASTNAVMGPSIIQNHPDFLSWVWAVERGFFFFVNRIPRFLAKQQYRARDNAMNAIAEYLADESNRKHGAPMIWDRDDQMREKGMQLQDRARYSYTAYAVSNLATPRA